MSPEKRLERTHKQPVAKIQPTAIFCRFGICSRRSHGLIGQQQQSGLGRQDIHRHEHGGKVCKYTESGIPKVKGWPVHAGTMHDSHVPGFRNRVAAKNISQYTGNAVTGGDEHEHPDGDMEVATGEDAHVKQ
jgi:hypothetical protein